MNNVNNSTTLLPRNLQMEDGALQEITPVSHFDGPVSIPEHFDGVFTEYFSFSCHYSFLKLLHIY
jgi:hypothetical protein